LKYPDPKTLLHAVQSMDYSSLLKSQDDAHPPDRDKIICSAGGVVAPCTIEWRPQVSRYFTGMFRRADFGLLRLSSVTQPCRPSSWSPYPALLPMIALKLFRDGSSPSANVVLARQKSGQKESNFLAHAVSNHFTENVALPFKAVLEVFKRYSSFPTFTGLADLATTGQDGQEEESPIAPYAMILLAPDRLRNRKVDASAQLIDQFRTFVAGDLLFEIYAVPEPVSAARLKANQTGAWRADCLERCPSPKAVWRVGDLRLSAPFVASEFSDRKLFFQHHLFEEDLQLRPEWKARVDTLIGAPEYQNLIEQGDLWDPPS